MKKVPRQRAGPQNTPKKTVPLEDYLDDKKPDGPDEDLEVTTPWTPAFLNDPSLLEPDPPDSPPPPLKATLAENVAAAEKEESEQKAAKSKTDNDSADDDPKVRPFMSTGHKGFGAKAKKPMMGSSHTGSGKKRSNKGLIKKSGRQ